MNETSTAHRERSQVETETERSVRLRREAVELAAAEQQIAAGQSICGAELEEFLAWFVSSDRGKAPDRSNPD
jgi:hypothetical protein